jgi:hypothetical protein
MNRFVLTCFAALLVVAEANLFAQSSQPALRKVEDLIVYRDDQFYSAFPSIVRRRDGELLTAFRRAPNR